MSNSKINAYVSVFADKLSKLKHTIKKELNKPKPDRSSKQLRTLLRDAKRLQKIVGNYKSEDKKVCRHCGGELN
jgi:hypothetical protein